MLVDGKLEVVGCWFWLIVFDGYIGGDFVIYDEVSGVLVVGDFVFNGWVLIMLYVDIEYWLVVFDWLESIICEFGFIVLLFGYGLVVCDVVLIC